MEACSALTRLNLLLHESVANGTILKPMPTLHIAQARCWANLVYNTFLFFFSVACLQPGFQAGFGLFLEPVLVLLDRDYFLKLHVLNDDAVGVRAGVWVCGLQGIRLLCYDSRAIVVFRQKFAGSVRRIIRYFSQPPILLNLYIVHIYSHLSSVCILNRLSLANLL